MPTCPTCRTRYDEGVEVCPDDQAVLLPDEACALFDDELEPGRIVGEYRIEQKIGEGGFGKVYRAVQPVIGKSVAIKVLSRQYSSSPEVVSRFVAEARAVNKIGHHNIIDIFSFGTMPGGQQFFVMELLKGSALNRYLAERGRLELAEGLPLLRAVARALDAAHAAGIAHRDLKPENVFLVFDDEGGCRPKLLDFGIAKLLGDEPGEHRTRTGVIMGTPLYMAPEQCRGRKVDQRADIYSFGVLTFEALTGVRPFSGEDIMELLVAHTADPPPAPSKVCPQLPAALDAAMLHMLAKQPEDRPETATAAIDAIIAAAADAGVEGIPSTLAGVARSAAAALETPSPKADATQTNAAAVRRPDTAEAATRLVAGAARQPNNEAATLPSAAAPTDSGSATSGAGASVVRTAAIAVIAALVVALVLYLATGEDESTAPAAEELRECIELCDQARAGDCPLIEGDCGRFCTAFGNLEQEADCEGPTTRFDRCLSASPNLCSAECAKPLAELRDCLQAHCQGRDDRDCQTMTEAFRP